MDLRELIQTRRTVGNYTGAKVDDALVEQALALSLWAPNHKLTFPWVYRGLGPETRARLATLAVELKSAQGPISEIKAKAIRESVMVPSHLISLGIKRSADAVRQHEDYATLACGVQIAALFLWDHGVASKWSTAGWSTHAKAYEIIGVAPEDVILEGCLMIGHQQILPKATERPPLAEVFKRTT
jgi:nitroreductase